MQKSRRILHQPFFPTTSTSPPAQPPSSSPPFPKYPFSSNPTPPFFPNFPSPPSPPSPLPPTSTSGNPSLPTFPANISSLIYPNSDNAPSHPSSHRLVPAIIFSLLGLSLLILASAFLFHRRRTRRHNQHPDPTRSDGHKLATSAPANSTSAPAAASANSSDFLYLGTLVNSRSAGGQHRQSNHQPPNAVPSPKMGSPELRPLPPLSRQARQNHGNATGRNSDEDDEEFYSPRADSSAAEKSTVVKCGSTRSSDTSSPSYPTSSGSPPSSPDPSSPVLDSSPANSGSKHSRSGSNPPPPGPPPPPPPPVGGNAGARIPPPPPPPPPPSFGSWESQIRNPPILVAPPRSPEAAPADNSEALEMTPRPKLKPLHWDKVRASSDRAMVWDQLKSSSFQ